MILSSRFTKNIYNDISSKKKYFSKDCLCLKGTTNCPSSIKRKKNPLTSLFSPPISVLIVERTTRLRIFPGTRIYVNSPPYVHVLPLLFSPSTSYGGNTSLTYLKACLLSKNNEFHGTPPYQTGRKWHE